MRSTLQMLDQQLELLTPKQFCSTENTKMQKIKTNGILNLQPTMIVRNLKSEPSDYFLKENNFGRKTPTTFLVFRK